MAFLNEFLNISSWDLKLYEEIYNSLEYPDQAIDLFEDLIAGNSSISKSEAIGVALLETKANEIKNMIDSEIDDLDVDQFILDFVEKQDLELTDQQLDAVNNEFQIDLESLQDQEIEIYFNYIDSHIHLNDLYFEITEDLEVNIDIFYNYIEILLNDIINNVLSANID